VNPFLKKALLLPALIGAVGFGVLGIGFGERDPARAEEPNKVRAVLELYTSQGCSTCPPADALFNQLVQDPTLVTLSFAVDYWDYLGWKDTAARPEFTQRQRAYADARGDRTVYTPQMIVDGRLHAVGSDKAAVEKAITASTTSGPPLAVDVGLAANADSITIDIPAAAEPLPEKATVWLVLFDRSHTVPIGRGENTGKTITYSHVVRSLQAVGMWKGKATRIELPRQDLARAKGTGCAVLVQIGKEGRLGPIVGAAILPDLAS
jgi:hypothetical protein